MPTFIRRISRLALGLGTLATLLAGCDFRDAVFEGGSLRNATLKLAKFTGADLRGADIEGVRVSDAQFKGAIISHAQAAAMMRELGLLVA